MLKYQIDTETFTALPEAHRELYEEGDNGIYTLRVDGAVPKARLDEFRKTNIDVSKKAEMLESIINGYKQVGEDPEKLAKEIQALRDLRKKVDDKELVAADGLEAALSKRTDQMRQDYQGRISALEASLNEERGKAEGSARQLEQHIINTQISQACIGAGVRPDAIAQVMLYSERAGWRINDKGKLVLLQNGEVSYGADGHNPLTPKEWLLSKVKEEASYFWPASTGGGAGGSGGSGTGAANRNPFTKDAWNVTEQGRLYRDNPQRYFQLAQAAGVKPMMQQ